MAFSLGIDSKVDAINAVLDAIGEVGINSEEEIDWNVDAAKADQLVDRVSQKIQSNNGKGWWFNREEFHKLSPDPVTGNVVVPRNTISAMVKRYNGSIKRVTLRGDKMFDAMTLGYDMRDVVQSDGYVHCILVVNLPFEALPDNVKHAVSDAAGYWMVNNTEGDQIKMAALRDAADAGMVAIQSEDASQRRRNMLNNKQVQSSVHLVGGYNNNP